MYTWHRDILLQMRVANKRNHDPPEPARARLRSAPRSAPRVRGPVRSLRRQRRDGGVMVPSMVLQSTVTSALVQLRVNTPGDRSVQLLVGTP